MSKIIRIGMDTSKSVFQLHGVDEAEKPVLRKQLRRRHVLDFFRKLPPTRVGMEACGGSHYWAREITAVGHQVDLMPAQRVKPYIPRNKNDSADADGACEAMSRPRMRFVPVKTAGQQADLMLAGVRDQMENHRTKVSNMIRSHAAEFGLVAAKGHAHVKPLLERIAKDETVPPLAKELFVTLGAEYEAVTARSRELRGQLEAWQKSNELACRLVKIPGIGPIGAALLVMKVADPKAFRCGRDFAAWMGLTPKDHSTAGKMRLGVITRAGDEELRKLLVVGATAVVQQARKGRGKPSAWLSQLIKRKPPKLVAVALANKMARIAWKLMVSGQDYDPVAAAQARRRSPVLPSIRQHRAPSGLAVKAASRRKSGGQGASLDCAHPLALSAAVDRRGGVGVSCNPSARGHCGTGAEEL